MGSTSIDALFFRDLLPALEKLSIVYPHNKNGVAHIPFADKDQIGLIENVMSCPVDFVAIEDGC